MESQGNTALEAEIRRRITQKGKITFAEFMDFALYHPLHGYYCATRHRTGTRGDFLTSPETHPVFGALIALQLEQMWRVLDRPSTFAVLEMGGGTGALRRSTLEYSRRSLPELHEAMQYILVDRGRDGGKEGEFTAETRSEGLRTSSERHGGQPGGNVSVPRCLNGEGDSWGMPGPLQGAEWTGDRAKVTSGLVGCFLSNELVDAFPVHAVTFVDGALREVFVRNSDDGFVEEIGDPSTHELAAYFDSLGLSLGEGYRAEVNLNAVRWMERVAGSLQKGFVLTIDYGFPAEELYSEKRRAGTLMCYHRHTYGHNPYARVGGQDLTTHVDFTSLIRAGLRAGLKFTGLISQSDFLCNLGLDAFGSALANARLSPAQYYNNRFALRRLAESEGLGKFRVLVQHKGVIEPSLDCFNPCNDRKRALVTAGRLPYIPLIGLPEE